MRLARLISYLIHPSLMPVIGILLARYALPYHFPDRLFYFSLGYVFLGTYLFPLLIAFGMVKLKFLSSIHMENRQERKYPYIIAILFYFLTARAIREFHLPPDVYGYLLAGSVILLIAYLLLPFQKMSVHVAGAAALVAFLLHISIFYQINLLLLISLVVLGVGLVSAARLKLNAHTMVEVVTGCIVGFSGMTLTMYFLFHTSLIL